MNIPNLHFVLALPWVSNAIFFVCVIYVAIHHRHKPGSVYTINSRYKSHCSILAIADFIYCAVKHFLHTVK